LVQLNPEQAQSVGYHCGRLLAVLEQVQRAAIPGAKATVVDRFFGTASSAPASVFGRLLRGAQPHLARLDRDKPAVHRALQRRLEEVQAQLQGFPSTLTLQEQGLFALGYYHQRAFDRAQARAAKERRQSGTATVEDEAVADIGDAIEATTQDENQ
jgi:CRISPR-associated protein Csd1